MSKSTNKHQVQQLLTMMQENPGIARGFFKGEKQEVQKFWERAECELNALGPPIKNCSEWKKVWTDQKKYVRQKAANNLKQPKGTGGGPNREQKLSPTEQAIYELIAMQTAIEGVSASSFGLGSPKNIANNSTCEMLDIEMLDMPEIEIQECAADLEYSRPAKPTTKKMKREKKETAADMLSAELKVQRELIATFKEIVVDVKEQKENIKKIYKSIDSLFDLQMNHFKEMQILKREEIQEMRRHHSVMEEMRSREIENKLKKS